MAAVPDFLVGGGAIGDSGRRRFLLAQNTAVVSPFSTPAKGLFLPLKLGSRKCVNSSNLGKRGREAADVVERDHGGNPSDSMLGRRARGGFELGQA
jgi:hypothetical protein